jgi:magnesium transporter
MEKEFVYFQNLVDSKNWKEVKGFLSKKHASEAAEFLKALDSNLKIFVFRLLAHKFSAKIFSYFSPKQRDIFFKNLKNSEIKRILADLTPDDRTELFEESSRKSSKRLMRLLSSQDLKETKQLLKYPEDSVGRLMTPDFISVKPDWTVDKVLKHIKKHGEKAETVDIIYLVDSSDKLIDDIKIRNLLLAKPKIKVSNLASPCFAKLSPLDDQEKALKLIKTHNLVALPVVDKHNVLLGIVTIDDLIDIGEEEATEDFHKSAALSVEGKSHAPIGNIMETSLRVLYRTRIGWLMILVAVNIFSGAAIASFEDTIAQAVALVFFLPLLIDSGGNTGAQASTLMIRALSLGDVKIGDWFKLLGREFLIALSLGITMALGVMLIGFFRGGPEIAMIAATSMVLIVLVGGTVGMSLPFLFMKFNRDPAAASGPLITSIADICGVLIYFQVANFYLGL